MTKNTKFTKYSVARVGDLNDIMRHNDGSMIIMQGEPMTDEYRPAMVIPMVAKAKRGEAWKTSDPDQEAFAARVVRALNDFEVPGLPNE